MYLPLTTHPIKPQLAEFRLGLANIVCLLKLYLRTPVGVTEMEASKPGIPSGSILFIHE